MLYTLVKITNRKGVDKEECAYRLHRVFEINKDLIKIGERVFLKCVDPGCEKSLFISNVCDVTQADDGLIITTENSIYFLVEKEIADWYEEQEYQMNVEMASHFDMNGDPIS